MSCRVINFILKCDLFHFFKFCIGYIFCVCTTLVAAPIGITLWLLRPLAAWPPCVALYISSLAAVQAAFISATAVSIAAISCALCASFNFVKAASIGAFLSAGILSPYSFSCFSVWNIKTIGLVDFFYFFFFCLISFFIGFRFILHFFNFFFA